MNDKQLAAAQEAQRDYLRQCMAKAGWTSTRLARKSGLDPSTTNRFLKGGPKVTHRLKLDTLTAVSTASGVPIPKALLATVEDAPALPANTEAEIRERQRVATKIMVDLPLERLLQLEDFIDFLIAKERARR